MSDELHVLVYGLVESGICDYYRFTMHAEPLRRLGVVVRRFSDYRFAVPSQYADNPDAALADENFVLDRSEIDWADVIVFRRFYQTVWSCGSCPFVSESLPIVQQHTAATRHNPPMAPERLVRPLFAALERDPGLLRGRAVVYETDDDLLRFQPWNGMRLRAAPERDLIERMLARADLVTVSTPVLAGMAASHNDAVRVVRNAIDTRWYERGPAGPAREGDPRILYYGLAVRMRDYEVCRSAVDETARRYPAARRVWLGATDAPLAGGSPLPVIEAVDETLPFVDGIPQFAQALLDSRPDIGVAPVIGDDFDRAKSELHWLEYSMAGAATVASRTMYGGPYDVIRPGVDGLLARGKREWLEALLRLAASRTLREEIAGRARERVIAEYDVEVRAREWADAYRWAAEHAGRGAVGRLHAVGAAAFEGIEASSRAALAHRHAARRAAAGAAARLEEARAGRESCGRAPEARLVSVLVPVVDEQPALVARAIRSALTQTHQELEVLVGCGAPRAGLRESLLALDDPRVRWVPLDAPAHPVPPAGDQRALAAEAATIRGLQEAATGDWIAPLAPDGEFDPEHVALLLEVAAEHALEFVYGLTEVIVEGRTLAVGSWPPARDTVMTTGTELYAAALRDVVPYDPDAWLDGEPAGWNLWRRCQDAGVRMANVEACVHRIRQLAPGSAASTA